VQTMMRSALEDLKPLRTTLVFFESPKRVVKTVAAMAEVFGAEREAAMCRELTKVYEEILPLPLGELLENLKGRGTIKGEIVLVIGPPEGDAAAAMDADKALATALKTLSVKEAAATVAALTGKSKHELYERALILKGKK